MNHSWNIRKFGDICTSELGKTRDEKRNKGSFRPYLCAINVQWDRFELSDLKEMRFEDNEYDRYTVRKGDLVICEGGDIGRAAIWDKEEPIHYQNALHRVRFDNGVNARFILYYLYFLKQAGILDGRYGKGVTIKHLVKSSLLSIPVPVPPLNEQQRIVDELDLLTGIIDKKNAQLRDLDALAQSIYYEMFGDSSRPSLKWEKKLLEDMVTASCSISYGIVQPGDGEQEGVPVVRPVDMIRIFTTNRNLKKTTKEISDAYKRTILRGNELLLCVRGTTGIVSMADENLAGCNVSRGITPLEFSNEISRWFMYYQFKTDSVQHTISRLTHGIALKGINMSDVRKLELVCPPFDEQLKFEKAVKSIHEERLKIEASLRDSLELYNSRMAYYFSY